MPLPPLHQDVIAIAPSSLYHCLCHQLLPQVAFYYYCSSRLLHFTVDNTKALSPLPWPLIVANKFLDCSHRWLIVDFLDYFFFL